jgi:hypothetical protein
VRARPAPSPPLLQQRKLTYAVAAAALVFAVVPLAVIAATPPLHDSGRKAVQLGISLIPVSPKFDVRTTAANGGVQITWKAQPSHGAKVFYRVLRGKGQDVLCGGRLNNAADDCHLYADDVGATRATTFVDHPGTGSWTYHVGVAANWLNDPKLGDVYVVSPPVAVPVG